MLERLVDACAHKLGIAPEELRARNFVKPDQMPYHTHTDRDYDVGDFEGAMRACLKKADQSGFKRRADDARARGKIRGFGFASYIECTAWGEGEEGSVGLDRNGDFTVLIGTQSTGQGHETAYAQIVAQYLDVPIERVKVVQGDTDRIPTGNGTGGSRSIPIGAVMVSRASETLAGSLKELAADKLEAAVADLEIADGKVRIAGTDRAISYSEVAALPGAAAKLTATESFAPPSATYPNGTHACEVEIDPDTGVTTIVRYSVVDDFGFTLNPMLLAGQVHGGIAQGAGQALMEQAVFDDDGQLADRKLPRLLHAPRRRSAGVRFRDAQRAVDDQSDGSQRRRRSRLNRVDAGGDERGRRRFMARLPRGAHRHASDPVRRVQRDQALARSRVDERACRRFGATARLTAIVGGAPGALMGSAARDGARGHRAA